MEPCHLPAARPYLGHWLLASIHHRYVAKAQQLACCKSRVILVEQKHSVQYIVG